MKKQTVTKKKKAIAFNPPVMLSLPSDQQLVEIALLFNDGKIEREKLADMVGMCKFVLNRLKEHNDVTRAASCEKEDGNGA